MEKIVDTTYKVPRWLGYGPHWDLAEDQVSEMSAAIDGCLTTLPDKQVNRLVEWGAKVAPWVTLTFLAVPLTVERIQETRYLMAMERQRQEIERRRRNGEPILEISRTPRADQGAPIINDASATVPTTEGVVEPTTPVSPFGRGAAGENAGTPDHDGRGRDHRHGGWTPLGPA